VQTPTIRVATRRSLFWILVAVFLVVLALGTVALTGTAGTAGTAYSATNAAPSGSKAIAEVLGQHGVTVTVAGSLAVAKSVLTRNPHSTLMFVDQEDYLDASQLGSLVGLAQHVVVLAPTYAQLAEIAPGIDQAGPVANKSLAADCALPAATRAGTVSGEGLGYRVSATGMSAVQCFDSGRSTYSVVDIDHSGRRITIVGTTRAFTNEHVSELGNAALALTLLGDNKQLVWYQPTIDDVATTGHPTLAQLTAPWVNSVIVLLIITGIAAAVWRGRRMGPLIVENLPVTVRASETLEGRARLYQKGSARLRAVDALRIGAVTRLAATCGLPRLATTGEIVSAVAGITGLGERDIRSLLLDDIPRSDRDLIALSDALLRLERTTADAVRPQQGE